MTMIISKDIIEAVAARIEKFFTLEVHTENEWLEVYAETPGGINEFEARLVAAVYEEDGGDMAAADLPVYLDMWVNITDTRSIFEPLILSIPSGTWRARYRIIPGERTNLYG